VKISKLFAITLQSKTRLIFFFVLTAYNLLLGVYLKDFLVLSPVLLTFYLLSVLPTLFLVLKIRSTPMRAIVLIVLFFVMVMSIVSALSCRRLLPMLTFVVTAIEMMYFGIVDNSSGKDKLLTKICVLVLTAFIAVLLFFSYNFVYKPEALIFPTAEIPCGIHKRKNLLTKFVQTATPMPKRFRRSTVGSYRTLNTTMNANPLSSTLMFARHCEPNKVFALISRTCSSRSAEVKIYLATLLTVYPIKTARLGTLGTACTMTELGGTWI